MKKGFVMLLFSLVLMSGTAQTIELVKKDILGGKVEILLPKEFGIMSEEMMKVKYPSDRRPTLVYTDEPGTINVAFNHSASQVTQEQIETFKDSFVGMFKNLYPSAEWKSSGVKVINGRKVGYLELITPAVDTKIYNLLFFTDLDSRLLICTFNCVEAEQVRWTDPAQKILNSLTLK